MTDQTFSEDKAGISRNMQIRPLVFQTWWKWQKSGGGAELNKKCAYTFLEDGENAERHLRYRQLYQKARAIAALLQEAGLKNDRVLLLCPPGLDFICAFFGCLYAGVIAIPAYLQVNQQILSTVEPIVKDANPKVILTNDDVLTKLNKIKFFESFGQKSNLNIIRNGIHRLFPVLKILNEKELILISTDKIDENFAQNWQEPKLNSDSLAFLQYTSGSTSKPKGVMVSHANLLHNQYLIKRYFNHPLGFVMVS